MVREKRDNIGIINNLTTTVNSRGEPTVEDMLIVAEKAGLSKQRVGEIIQEIADRLG